MSKSLLISMLRKGSTGTEIMKILDTIIAGDQEIDYDEHESTLEEIEF